jgi:transposase
VAASGGSGSVRGGHGRRGSQASGNVVAVSSHRRRRLGFESLAARHTPWRLLPAQELGCGSPATCWRRLHEWAKAGVFEALHLDIVDRLGERARLDWSRASVDSASLCAKRGGTTLARIARRGVESSERLGRHRWKVERTLSWLSCYRRLAIRWDRGSGRFFAFVLLACVLVCFNRL